MDSLFDAQNKTSPDRMGDNATKDFILRHVFGVAAELISTEVEPLRFLLRLHYGNSAIPSMLEGRLVEVFESSVRFKGWSLSQIIPDAEKFFVFIQERWPIFLESLNAENQVKEDSEAYGLKVQGPVTLPFDHQDIRVYIDNLFVEGKLTPVDFPGINIAKDSWILSGIAAAKSDSEDIRISRLFEIVDAADLSMDSRYTDWIAFACRGQMSAVLASRLDPGAITVIKGNKPLSLRYSRKHRAVLYASEPEYIEPALDDLRGWRELEIPRNPKRVAEPSITASVEVMAKNNSPQEEYETWQK